MQNIKINLLPWREIKIVENNRLFALVSALSILAAGIILLLLYFFYEIQIAQIQANNNKLTKELSHLGDSFTKTKAMKVKKENLEKNLLKYQQLFLQKNYLPRLLESISTAVPAGLYLKNFSLKDNQAELNGLAKDNLLASKLVADLKKNSWITQVSLVEIKSEKNLKSFKIKFIFSPSDHN